MKVVNRIVLGASSSGCEAESKVRSGLKKVEKVDVEKNKTKEDFEIK